MKLFQNIQKNFSILVIASNQTKRIRTKLAITLIIYGLTTTSSVLFLVFTANTFIEFTTNIYITSAFGVICIIFTVIAVKQENLFHLIDDFEKFIDKSELNTNVSVESSNSYLTRKSFQNANTQHRFFCMKTLVG